MINLCSAKYSEYYGTHDCECGFKHEFTVKCCLEKGALCNASQFLASFTPELSRVIVFYDPKDVKAAEVLEAGIKRSYRTSMIVATDDKSEVEKLVLPEDAKLIIAVGSKAIEGGKYKATLCDLPLIASGELTHISFMPLCALSSDGGIVVLSAQSPTGYIFDQSLEFDKADVFGSIAACLNTSFECYASMALSDKDYCPFLCSAMSDIAAKTVLAASECDKNSTVFKEMLLTSALKIALIASKLALSGEEQCALVSRLLLPHYSLGKLEFIYGAILSSLYKRHVLVRRSFVPPPDNNYRLEQIAELFGISEFAAVKTIVRQMSASEAELIDYKIAEYANDFSVKLGKNVNLYTMAFRTFKRLLPDGGFGLCDIVSSELAYCLALAPDMVRGDGMLTTLKRLGELDCYID